VYRLSRLDLQADRKEVVVTGGDEKGRIAMFMPSFIKLVESGVNMLSQPATSAAKFDEMYYATEELTKGERQQAMALLAEQNVPEGSIFVVSSGNKQSFDVVPRPARDGHDTELQWNALRGRQRGAKVVEMFLENPGRASIETVVIPGCGSSALGAAALAKSVAEAFRTDDSDRKVAAIVAGQGAFDQWLEAASGGMLMAPMANLMNALDPMLELTASMNPVLAKFYIDDLVDAIHEAATLYAMLKASLVDGTFSELNMIISHSKGNWAVLAALLAFELELPELERAGKLKEPGRRIAVVTFGNPVDLPDMHRTMKKLFHYHQFVGAADKLAHNCSMRAWKFHFNGEAKLDPRMPSFDAKDDPDERMFIDTEHHLFAKLDPETGEELKPYHMPIKEILNQIRQL